MTQPQPSHLTPLNLARLDPAWLDPSRVDPAWLDPDRQDVADLDVQEIHTPNPLRLAVIHRLGLAARRHAHHRAGLRGPGEQAVGPHAVVFLLRFPYSGPDPTDADYGPVRIANRTFLYGPDVADLHHLLDTLHIRAGEFHMAGVRNLIAKLSDGGEPFTRTHHYLGLATISVHPPGANPLHPDPTGTTATPAMVGAWPGWLGLAQLIDRTRLVIRARSTLDTPRVTSSHTIDLPPEPGSFGPTHPGLNWALRIPAPADAGPFDPVQDLLTTLHLLIARAEAERRSTRPHRWTTRTRTDPR